MFEYNCVNKMSYKIMFVLLSAIGIVLGNYISKGYTSTEPDQPFYEVPCTANGGICVHAADCPRGYLAPTRGLCPLQQRNGVECCYAVAASETRCRQNGGECVALNSKCPDNLTFGRATDCAYDQKCCIRV